MQKSVKINVVPRSMVAEVLSRDPGAPASIYPSKALDLVGKHPRNLSRFPLEVAFRRKTRP